MSFMNANRAFKRGFAEGFASPFQFFAGRTRRNFYVPTATDATAWREVGALLNQAYNEVGEELGQAPSETSKNSRASRR